MTHVEIEPRTSRFGVRRSITTPPRSLHSVGTLLTLLFTSPASTQDDRAIASVENVLQK